MMAECSRESFLFHGLGRREIVARFDGGDISSDAGATLLLSVEQRRGILRRLGRCFSGCLFGGCFTPGRPFFGHRRFATRHRRRRGAVLQHALSGRYGLLIAGGLVFSPLLIE